MPSALFSQALTPAVAAGARQPHHGARAGPDCGQLTQRAGQACQGRCQGAPLIPLPCKAGLVWGVRPSVCPGRSCTWVGAQHSQQRLARPCSQRLGLRALQSDAALARVGRRSDRLSWVPGQHGRQQAEPAQASTTPYSAGVLKPVAVIISTVGSPPVAAQRERERERESLPHPWGLEGKQGCKRGTPGPQPPPDQYHKSVPAIKGPADTMDDR